MSGQLRHVRRAIVATALAALAVTAVAPTATAAQARDSADTESTNHEITGLLRIDGNLSKLVDLKGITQLVDGLGRAIGSPRNVALRSDVTDPDLGEYSCVYRGNWVRNNP